ncbi:MAG: hypothetical protein ACI4WS_02160 [Oscillospiraceae bacterium]
MSVLKRNSVCFGGGVDISNAIEPHRKPVSAAGASEAQENAQGARPDPEQELHERKQLLEQRLAELDERERSLEQQKQELDALKARYVEQGKAVIAEAQRRAEAIITAANDNASQIISDAETNRDSVYIKAKADGFAQGQKDGTDACLAAGRDILDEARAYADKINSEKELLFADYEKDIYDTVMQIAKKVTLDSITSKDSAAIKRLIKKAAKEFRNSDRIKITLKDNGANEELVADYEYLKELCGGIQYVDVELLPEAEEGTVIVDNGSEIVDAGIQTQLRMIQELGDGKFKLPTRKKKKTIKPAEDADEEE